METSGNTNGDSSDGETDADELGMHLRAGAAIYNGGEFHAAHDAWEALWLDMENGPDRDLFQGLIQFTAAVHHADQRNWEGTTGLAASARTYLSGLGPSAHGVALDPIRSYLADLARDPELIERQQPIGVEIDGAQVMVEELPFAALTIAARVTAEEYEYDTPLIEQAIEYARADLAAERVPSRFVTLLVDFIGNDQNRRIIFRRLGDHADRREHRDSDVEGLFE